MTIICGVAGEKTPVSAHPAVFLFGRTLTGTLFGGLKPKSDLPKYVEMYMNKVALSTSSNVTKCYRTQRILFC